MFFGKIFLKIFKKHWKFLHRQYIIVNEKFIKEELDQ